MPEQHRAFVFSGQEVPSWSSQPLKITALCSFETSGNTHPKTPHHSPKDPIFQKLCCRTSNLPNVKGKKDEVHPITGHKGPDWEGMYSSTLALTSTLDGGGWSMPCPHHFSPRKDPVPIVWEAGWTPGPVWTSVLPLLGFNPGLSSR
jgi:hypothetical protein